MSAAARLAPAALVLTAVSLPTHAAPDSALGIEVMRVNQTLELNGVQGSAQGTLGGVYGSEVSGWFRSEGRLLSGSFDYSSSGVSATDSGWLFQYQGTGAVEVAPGVDVYGGLGWEQVHQEAPLDGGSGDARTLYLPVGVRKAAPYRAGWTVVGTVEVQYLASATQDVTVKNVGSTQFEQGGGFGLEVSMRFRDPAEQLAIEPYLAHTRPADSEITVVQGTPLEITDARSTSGGVRLLWLF